MNYTALADQAINYIKDRMQTLGGKNIIVGISGGKDSSVCAALSVKALGKDHVYGVLMPQGEQKDLDDAIAICEHLGIAYTICNIGHVYDEIIDKIEGIDWVSEVQKQTRYNLAPRLRMSLLYGISQSMEATFVINTSNLSEDWVGYATIYGDTAGAFSPLGELTSDEVIEIGLALGLPEKFVRKAPADGLTGKTDEDVLGFTYATLNRYLRTGQIDDPKIKEKIDTMHRNSRFKFVPIDMMKVDAPIVPKDLAGVYHK